MSKEKVFTNKYSLLLLVLGALLVVSYSKPSDKYDSNAAIVKFDKQKGAHVFGRIDSSSFEKLSNNNIEWVTIVTWAYQDDHESGAIRHYNKRDSLALERNNAHLRDQIIQMRNAGFNVFLKPHLWISDNANGKWRSDIFPKGNERTNEWKNDYRDYILNCARVAEQTNTKMFCLGAELTLMTEAYPEYWLELIREIRKLFSGKITYAANWYKEIESVEFWNELDYIGIQAYFPLVKNNDPSVEELSNAWSKYLPVMEKLSRKYDKQILFTEMGYKSTSDSAVEPWKWLEKTPKQERLYSLETQANCYQAFFNSIWRKPWFAGVHIWQFRSDHKDREGRIDMDFSPQGKPAELIIANAFK